MVNREPLPEKQTVIVPITENDLQEFHELVMKEGSEPFIWSFPDNNDVEVNIMFVKED